VFREGLAHLQPQQLAHHLGLGHARTGGGHCRSHFYPLAASAVPVGPAGPASAPWWASACPCRVVHKPSAVLPKPSVFDL
jgi:hypothetical protein